LPVHVLIQSVDTRWTSEYQMLQRLVEQKEVIPTTLEQVGKSLLNLSADNWNILSQLAQVQQPFYEAITFLEGAKYPTLAALYPVWYSLTTAAKTPVTITLPLRNDNLFQVGTTIEALFEDGVWYRGVVQEVKNNQYYVMYDDGDEQWEFHDKIRSLPLEEDELITKYRKHLVELLKEHKPNNVNAQIATMLHPSFFKLTFLSETKVQSWRTLFESEYKIFSDQVQNNSPPKTPAKTVLPRHPRTLFATIQSTSPTTKTELELFYEEESIPTTENPLQWWKTRELKFPILSKMAKTYLAIPASSTDSERLFSTAGIILTHRRNRLGYARVEALSVQHSNGKKLNQFLPS